MPIICADGTPYSTEGRCAVEILFAIEERVLAPDEFDYYIAVTTKINAAAERVAAMTDAEILRK